MSKKRLDLLLVEKELTKSRALAQALILEGKVLVNGKKVSKAGTLIPSSASIELLAPLHSYVSRGGLKLEKALETFSLKVAGKICLDIGASTGGFTDCLLQKGAKRVYAIDVGRGQLAWEIRGNPRIIVFEGENFRYFKKEKIPEVIDLIVIDVSFISLSKIIPKALEFLAVGGDLLALIKPQFELSAKEIPRGGIVKDEKKQKKAVEKVRKICQELRLQPKGIIPAAIKGAKGNQEFFILCQR